jgi:hypothetical protein
MVTRAVMLHSLSYRYRFVQTCSSLIQGKHRGGRFSRNVDTYQTTSCHTQQNSNFVSFQSKQCFMTTWRLGSQHGFVHSARWIGPVLPKLKNPDRVTPVTGYHAITTLTQWVGTASYFCATNKHTLHSRTLSWLSALTSTITSYCYSTVQVFSYIETGLLTRGASATQRDTLRVAVYHGVYCSYNALVNCR